MKKKLNRYFTALAFCVFLPLAKINAASVIFQVFQNDSSCEKILETTVLVNQILLDKFFEYGDIACDSPAVIFKSKETAEDVQYGTLVEAAESYMDFYIVIQIDYDRTQLLNPEAVQLGGIKAINWKATKVMLNETVAEGSVKPVPKAAAGKTDTKKEVERFISAMAKEIKNGLK